MFLVEIMSTVDEVAPKSSSRLTAVDVKNFFSNLNFLPPSPRLSSPLLSCSGKASSRGGGGREHQAQDVAGGGEADLVEPGEEAIGGLREERADSAGVRGAEGGGEAAQDSGRGGGGGEGSAGIDKTREFFMFRSECDEKSVDRLVLSCATTAVAIDEAERAIDAKERGRLTDSKGNGRLTQRTDVGALGLGRVRVRVRRDCL